MLGIPTSFWGKLGQDPSGAPTWHPLRAHCADVAACVEALLTRTLLGARFATLANLPALSPSLVARLGVLAALHALGKFNQHFQNKGHADARPREGHVREVMVLFDPNTPSPEQRKLRDALPLADLARWGTGRDTAMELLYAAVGHHGRPVPVKGNGVQHVPARWVTMRGLDPFVGIRALVDDTRRWFPEAWALPGTSLPTSPEFAHAFSGLVMLADWIGSNTAHFPFADTDDDRMPSARTYAQRALRAMHLDVDDDRAPFAGTAPSFTAVTARPTPRAAQAKTLALPMPRATSLTLLESETGSGKTEAAFLRFLQLFVAGAVDGMYFALPTRTAAKQIFDRLTALASRAFPDPALRPPVVLAVPGYLEVDDLTGTRLPGFEVLWKDDGHRTQATRDVRARTWAAEHPKRYLAAPIAVGTLDQALLSTLTVEHAHLRGTALLRHLLVVDEVHASDVYMGRLLDHVLRAHRAAGGHALLMSATLGSVERERLFGTAPLPLATAVAAPYPLLTHAEGEQRASLPVGEAGSPKTFAWSRRPWIDDPEAVAREALSHARRGARVIVLRNTVRDALAVQNALEGLATVDDRALLFTCGGVVALHHARYAREDRVRLDEAIERDYGVDSPAQGRVTVATQTVQQALDLDADLLITDLCPMDVLLQRIGRLHRHARHGAQERPEGYKTPQALVLVPGERNLAAAITTSGEAKGRHGFGTVYSDLRVLHATWCQIEAATNVSIPTMNRALVEATTHPEALRAVTPTEPSSWAKHAAWCDGVRMAHRRAADLALLDRTAVKPLQRFGFLAFPDASTGEHITTRLGEGDRRIVFDPPCPGPFGGTVRELTVPAHLARGATADDEPTVTMREASGFAFTLGPNRYRYDRHGLQRADDRARPEETHG